jgi:hypothetical protein
MTTKITDPADPDVREMAEAALREYMDEIEESVNIVAYLSQNTPYQSRADYLLSVVIPKMRAARTITEREAHFAEIKRVMSEIRPYVEAH